ncbi:hypothetical protein DJ028_29910 [Pseudomonas veronii]|jgi:hypothetical protein|nr:hypothetical protein [Pseudomonas veronii]NWC56048.1 hypothetical protein [Pseudomonas veronii]RWA24086.1 hypothetical protein DJ028_29910 [Pseudomonas veronii]URS63631.1 hypothetical protein JN756_13580 [Pseudomonas sp. Y39-6]
MTALWMGHASVHMQRVTQTSAALLLLLNLSGCAQNQTLAPPPGGEQVSIVVKVPQNLAAEPMQVMYRSEKCPIKRSGPDWTTYEEDGYLSTMVQPQQQGQSDLYEAKLPINGGSRCQWQLSNVTFGVTYANTTHFGENVKAGPGGGVIVMFDQHLPQRRSAFQPTIEVSGDLLIRKDYYPRVSEHFLGGHEKLARLFGEGEIYLYYRAKNARQVVFEPVLHADYVLYSVGPKVKKEGNYTRYTYPDGSVVADGRDPSFKKLQSIRLTAEKVR